MPRDAHNAPQAVVLYREALRRDDASPYRWADLAEALADSGDSLGAHRCFERALLLAPAIPQIWVRHVNFSLMQGEPGPALASAARVLATTPEFDGVLFNYFDRAVEDPNQVIAAIGTQPRAMQSWLKHLLERHDTQAARLAWREICTSGRPEPPLASQYVGYLLAGSEPVDAMKTWAEWVGPQRGDYPSRNLVFNGRFQFDPTGSPLDWSINRAKEAATETFQIVRENEGLRIRFDGTENVNFEGVSQVVVLPQAGQYDLEARIRTEGITTNEGIRLGIPELGLASDSLTGSQPWRTVRMSLRTDRARTVRVAVVRRPSEKFDNKIAGTAWVSDVSLTRK